MPALRVLYDDDLKLESFGRARFEVCGQKNAQEGACDVVPLVFDARGGRNCINVFLWVISVSKQVLG